MLGLFSFLAVLMYTTALAAPQESCLAHAAVTVPMVMQSLAPWLAARRVLTSNETVAAFKAASRGVMPVLVYNASVFITRLPDDPLFRGFPVGQWVKPLGELVQIAAADPDLRLEFMLNLGDNPLSTSAATGVPVWGFSHQTDFVDIAIPHYYVFPDEFCRDTRHRKPWSRRRNTVIGRFTHFCPRSKVTVRDDWRLCPRTYFTELTERMSNSTELVKLDIATTNQLIDHYDRQYMSSDNTTVKARGHVPLHMFSDFKYVCVTDGYVGPGKLSAALALGSVVLIPASSYRQYFEAALVPWVHFVPIWVNSRDDILGVVAWLHSNPLAARRIAKAGRTFACSHLGLSGRTCWWKSMATAYREGLLGYELDDAWLESRRAAFGDDMLELTHEVLQCEAQTADLTHNSLPSCVYKGPVTPTTQ